MNLRDSHRSKLYNTIHIAIFIYDTDTLTIHIMTLQDTNRLGFLKYGLKKNTYNKVA